MQLVSKTKEKEMEQHSGGTAPKIKKERIDEHEINQLALEMAEKNRQKMITQAAQIRQQNQVSQQALQRAGGQQMITFYFNRDKDVANSSSDSLLPKKVEEKKKGTIDEESLKGRFGWSTIHNVHIPYLLRNEERYCAVRMVESKLLYKYLNALPNEITTCIHVRSYFITDVEAKLLNEINGKHCDFQFGKEAFTNKDLIVRLSDAKHFYKFLDTCYKKLVQRSPEQSEFCGFVRINGESVVPYTVKSSVKYVPLFYFEGETETLKLKAEKIEGWELAFLKFCCKVQGIRNELFASDTCAVVSLEDVKQYFPKDTQFEDWWPQKTAEPLRVLSHGTKPGGNWTQRPPVPVTSQNTTPTTVNSVVNKVPTVNSTASIPHKVNTTLPSSITGLTPFTNSLNINNLNNLYSQWSAAATLMNGQAAQQIQAHAQAQALAAAYGGYAGMQTFLSDHVRGVSRNSAILPNISVNSQSTLRPPPLVRSTNSSAVTSQTYSSNRLGNSNLDALRHLGYLHDQTSSNPLDALINPGRQQSATTATSHNLSLSAAKSQSKVPPPLIPVSNGIRTDNNLSSHKGVGRTLIDKHKLLDVPPFRPDETRMIQAYEVRKVTIDNKPLYCINFAPYIFNEQNMIAIQDILKEFFPAASLSECTEVFLTVLKVSVFKANWHQVRTLMEVWGSTKMPDIVPLVKSSDVNQYLSQIKYIFLNKQNLAQSQAKRLRT